jgi:hypothetical protein
MPHSWLQLWEEFAASFGAGVNWNAWVTCLKVWRKRGNLWWVVFQNQDKADFPDIFCLPSIEKIFWFQLSFQRNLLHNILAPNIVQEVDLQPCQAQAGIEWGRFHKFCSKVLLIQGFPESCLGQDRSICFGNFNSDFMKPSKSFLEISDKARNFIQVKSKTKKFLESPCAIQSFWVWKVVKNGRPNHPSAVRIVWEEKADSLVGKFIEVCLVSVCILLPLVGLVHGLVCHRRGVHGGYTLWKVVLCDTWNCVV